MKNIGIIGAGITGLVAAYRLTQKGHSVTIFEKNSDIGGLLSTTPISGGVIEKAYHHLFRGEKHAISLINELGLGDKLYWQHVEKALYQEERLFPFSTPIDLLRLNVLSPIDRARVGLVSFYLQRTKDWNRFEGVSASSWLKRWAGKNAYTHFFQPMLSSKFGENFKDVQMSWFWARMYSRASSSTKFGFGEELGYMRGSFNELIDALQKASQLSINNSQLSDNSLLLNTPVSKIESNNKKVAIIAEGKYSFDKVLVTVANPVFSEMISDESNGYKEKLKSIRYLGAVELIFASEQKLTDYYWTSVFDENVPFLVVINHTKMVDNKSFNGKYVYYLGAYVDHDSEDYKMSDSSLMVSWLHGLAKVFPKFDEALISEKNVFRMKYAQHVPDNSYKSNIPSFETPIPNVYLSNFTQIYPWDRGMNFAVRDVERVVELMER